MLACLLGWVSLFSFLLNDRKEEKVKPRTKRVENKSEVKYIPYIHDNTVIERIGKMEERMECREKIN